VLPEAPVTRTNYVPTMRAFAEMVAPVRCVSCGAEGDELCQTCAPRVHALTPPWCYRCGTPLEPVHRHHGRRWTENAKGHPTNTHSCPACRGLDGFDTARSLVMFAEPARALTLQLKRRGRIVLAQAIGELLALLATREQQLDETTSVAWVPGGRTATSRGFDHAALMANAVARAADSSARPLLRRAQDGPRQADVPLKQRRANVAGRFVAQATKGRVLLVDDVYTTGSTAEACARALKNAGAQRVDVVTWARTPRLRPR
jgi:predicted amidophosphoribosyltransferase